MNTKHLLLLLTILTSSSAISQERTYYGKVVDDYNVKLHSVEIYINSIKMTTSECKGKFEVQAQVGDTIRFKKEGYVSFETVLERKRRIKVELRYDYTTTRQIMNDYYSKVYDGIEHYSQPFYVVDGIIFVYNTEAKDFGSTASQNDDDFNKNLKNFERVKGKKATELFGKYAINGVFLFTTNCHYITDKYGTFIRYDKAKH